MILHLEPIVLLLVMLVSACLLLILASLTGMIAIAKRLTLLERMSFGVLLVSVFMAGVLVPILLRISTGFRSAMLVCILISHLNSMMQQNRICLQKSMVLVGQQYVDFTIRVSLF